MTESKMTIRDFILGEMEKRNMSMREFSREMGIGHATVSRILDGHQEPSLEFLMKLSKFTKVRLGTLAEIVYPDAVTSGQSPSEALIGQMVENLPDHLREAVMTILRSRVH